MGGHNHKTIGFRTEILCGKTYEIPLKSEGVINWGKLSKEEIIELAKAWCKQHEVTTQNQLKKGPAAFYGLYNTLYVNKWFPLVLPVPKIRTETLNGKLFNLPLDRGGRINWKSMKKQRIVAYACAYCE